jgi:hypothetical protein
MIPFHMNGMILCISANHLLTQDELDKCEWIYMTSKKTWNPYDDDWTIHEVQAVQAAERNELYHFKYPTHYEHAAYDHHGQ